MEFRIDFYPGTEEARIIGEALLALAQVKSGVKCCTGIAEDAPTSAEPQTTPFVAAVEAGTKTRKPRPKPEAVAAHIIATKAVLDTISSNPAPLPVVETVTSPALVAASVVVTTPAVKVWTNEEVTAAFRPHTRTNFVAAKALLDKFSVARFSLLPAEKLQEFGDAVAAMGPAPTA